MRAAVFALLCALALPAAAVTYTCELTWTGASFAQVCVPVGTAPTPPAPTDPRQPAPTPAPPASGCPATGAEIRDLANVGSSALHYGTLGTIYAYRMPQSALGYGFVTQADHPQTPTELTIEWAISKCPGDFAYYKTPAASRESGRGGTFFPCGGVNGAAGGAYYWSPADAGGYSECRVPRGEQWFLNVRYLNHCDAGGQGCPVSYRISTR